MRVYTLGEMRRISRSEAPILFRQNISRAVRDMFWRGVEASDEYKAVLCLTKLSAR